MKNDLIIVATVCSLFTSLYDKEFGKTYNSNARSVRKRPSDKRHRCPLKNTRHINPYILRRKFGFGYTNEFFISAAFVWKIKSISLKHCLGPKISKRVAPTPDGVRQTIILQTFCPKPLKNEFRPGFASIETH